MSDWNNMFRFFRNNIRDPYLDAQTAGAWSATADARRGIFSGGPSPGGSATAEIRTAGAVTPVTFPWLLALALIYLATSVTKFGSSWMSYRAVKNYSRRPKRRKRRKR